MRFEKFFAANGYHIVALEEYSLCEQAALIHSSKWIASVEGTHAHSVVWRTNVGCGGGQIILRKQSEVIPRQIMLNQLLNIELTFIDVFEEPYHGFPISHDRGPFLLRWTPQMENFAREHNMIVPQECRKGYCRDLMIYSLKCVYYRTKHMVKKIVTDVKKLDSRKFNPSNK